MRTNKKMRSHRNGAAGVVSSAKCFGSISKAFAGLTTPAASLRNGNFLLMSRPPLLFKEGKSPTPIPHRQKWPISSERGLKPAFWQLTWFDAECRRKL